MLLKKKLFVLFYIAIFFSICNFTYAADVKFISSDSINNKYVVDVIKIDRCTYILTQRCQPIMGTSQQLTLCMIHSASCTNPWHKTQKN